MPNSRRSQSTDSDQPSFPPLERSVGYLIRNAHRAFDRTLANGLNELGILTGQWSVMRVLWHEESLSQVELAERMKIERASLTTLLAGMEKLGMITRTMDSVDRRIQRIKLTAKGRRLEQKLVPIGEGVNSASTKGFTKDEVLMLRSLLIRLVQNLET